MNVADADACAFIFMKAIPGVEKIKDGYNPATWMLEVTSTTKELALGIDFTNIYKHSDLYRCVFVVLLSYHADAYAN